MTLSREEGINNWCHDVVDGNVYVVYLVEQVWTGVKVPSQKKMSAFARFLKFSVVTKAMMRLVG